MRQLRSSLLPIVVCVCIISVLVLTALPLKTPALAANAWYVSTAGSDATGNGSSGNPWRTIGYAVSNTLVLDGDTIMVAAGTYTESVSTSKSLTFKGAQWGVDARDRSGAESVWVVPSPNTPSAIHATPTTGTVTVDGFKFIGGPSCVDLERATAVFTNNIVEVPPDCTGPLNVYYLVRISNAGSVTIQHNDISATEAPPSLVVACMDVKISLNPGTLVVDSNRLHNAEECGGFLFEKGVNAGTMTFTNNEVYHNAGDGISVVGKFDSLTVTYNSIHDNAWCGMLIDYTGTQPGTVDIHNCDIYDNGLYGLFNATTSGNLTIDAAQNFWGDGTEQYPYNGSGAAFGPNISGVTTDPLPQPACAPSVTTGNATNIATTSARLNGNLTSLGTVGSVTVSFLWGTSSGSYTHETTCQVLTTTGSFFFDLGSLNPSTTYYYKAKAVGNGIGYGAEMNFATASVPSVTTNDATNISTTSARLNGDLVSLGSASSVTVSFVWGTSPGSCPNETTGQVMTTTGAFYFDLGSLTPSTTYYYKAKAVGNGTAYGIETSFTTVTPNPPTVNTDEATNIATTSAKLNGNLTSLGSASSVTVSFVWGTSPGSCPNETTGQVMTTTGAFYFDLSSLTPGINYCYQAKAVDHGTSYGEEKSFATTCIPPTVTTSDASNIGNTSARLNANLTSLGTANSVTVSFVWGTSSGVYPNETTGHVMTTTGATFVYLSSLAPGTTYYYSARAMGDGASYGAERSFTTTTTTTSLTATGWYEECRTNWYCPFTYALVYGQQQVFQTFTPSKSHYFNYVSLWLSKTGTPIYDITLSLYNVDSSHQPVGPALCTTSFSSYFVPKTATWLTYEFATGCPLAEGTEYALLISANGGNLSNRVNLLASAVDVYGNGQLGTSSDAGGSWQMSPTMDLAFKEGLNPWYESLTSTTPGFVISGQSLTYQTFTPSRDHYFSYVSLYLYKIGSPTYTVTVSLYNVDASNQPTGPALCSTSFTASSLSTKPAWRSYGFPSGYPLSAGTTYAVVISGSGSNGYVIVGANVTGGYAGGECGLSTNGGASWQSLSGPDLALREGQNPYSTAFTASNSSTRVYGQNRICQTFSPTQSHFLDYVSLSLARVGSFAGTGTVSIYNVDVNHRPVGTALCSTSFAASSLNLPRPSLSPSFPWYEFRFATGCELSAGTEYALVISGDAACSIAVGLYTKDYYSGGLRGSSADSGTTWLMIPTQDMAFMEGGVPSP